MASDSCQKGRGDTGLLSKLHQSPTNPGAESAPPNVNTGAFIATTFPAPRALVKTASSASRDNAKAKPTGAKSTSGLHLAKFTGPSGGTPATGMRSLEGPSWNSRYGTLLDSYYGFHTGPYEINRPTFHWGSPARRTFVTVVVATKGNLNAGRQMPKAFSIPIHCKTGLIVQAKTAPNTHGARASMSSHWYSLLMNYFGLIPTLGRSTAPSPAQSHGAAVLLNYDVLVSIFEYFYHEKKDDRLACASSARVCRAWMEIASAVLWGERRSLRPLYRILLDGAPTLATEYCDTITRKKAYKNPVRWASFLRCAARIRKLHPIVIGFADWELLKTLVSHNNGKTLFPQLRWLSWTVVPRSVNVLLAVVSPTTQHLNLTFPQASRALKIGEIECMLSLLGEVAPSLSSLSLFSFDPEHSISILEPLTAGTYSNLYDLTLTGVGADLVAPVLFERLCSLAHLRSLSVKIKGFVGHKTTIRAPYLRRLICTGACHDLIPLILHLDPRNLDAIEVHMPISEAADISPHATSVVRALCARPFAPQLLALTFSASTATRPLAELFVRLLDILSPALRLAQLRRVDVSIASTASQPRNLAVALPDADVRTLARAWPALEVLALRCEPSVQPVTFDPDPSRTRFSTPQALRHVAEHCPRLRRLELSSINYPWFEVAVAEAFAVPTQPWAGHALRMLTLPTTDAIPKTMQFAQFLDTLFPWLDIGASFPEAEAYVGAAGSWKVVWIDLRALRYRREEGVLVA
ncbi:hypothetical protein C8Q80DRAFT_1122877 [Daedaleopsis nitida]|nr:hypothetical protein C8Q80DRAFT_1122877 [Daedaleopsis nitida]